MLQIHSLLPNSSKLEKFKANQIKNRITFIRHDKSCFNEDKCVT